jgi:fructokinase
VRIGVDLGGTKIEAIALGDDGHELARRRIATPRHDYAATLDAIRELVAALERETAERGSVGIGMPGAISPASGLVKNANSTWLNGQALMAQLQKMQQDLSARLGRPCRFANDANCFALSEATDGAAAGARVVFGAILGTGTGGGIVVDGRVLTGPNAVAGEWGHNPLPWPRAEEWPGPPCYCGRSGRATGEERGTEQIVASADAGDARAGATLGRYEERLARSLAALINVLDPDTIVLGGGLSRIQRLYERVPALWSRFVFSDRVDTRLVPPRHGDSSGVRGAAWLWGAGEGQ